MIAIDASALAAALTDDLEVGDSARQRLEEHTHWVAPSLLFVEVLSVIRGRLLAGKIGARRAADSVQALRELVIDRIDDAAIINRIWELRSNLTAYDASYVATAEALHCPLLTADAKLARASGPRCEFLLLGETCL
ncbi:type II toxin-antitoxin system VapC family toxin [Sinosporangium siamense]|uniref:Ribonuclease VapC n=1 Tax=Sinosporangium siamense TaxID=1367973 RepID=A0A919RPV5_9ACTN|nr:type II toxin-antitoxin system VapC family toxin [Sinosporangium siamense]GII96236.1 VapC ribonuclease [Sinosporangium siamense]